VWKDPRNMNKKSLSALSNHIRQRQDEFGASEGFRFKAFWNGEEMVEAEYGLRSDDDQAAARSQRQKLNRKERRAKAKGKQTAAQGKNTAASSSGILGFNQTVASSSGNLGFNQLPSTGEIIADPPSSPAIPLSHDHVNDPPAALRPAIFIPQIDPILMGEATETPAGTKNGAGQGRHVGEIEMQLLKANGYPTSIPINGPNEGPPRYYIPPHAENLLNMIQTRTESDPTSQNNPHIGSEGNPKLSNNIKPSRKRKNPSKDPAVPLRRSNRGQDDEQIRTRAQRSRGKPRKF
jgi:hypothetical protein